MVQKQQQDMLSYAYTVCIYLLSCFVDCQVIQISLKRTNVNDPIT